MLKGNLNNLPPIAGRKGFLQIVPYIKKYNKYKWIIINRMPKTTCGSQAPPQQFDIKIPQGFLQPLRKHGSHGGMIRMVTMTTMAKSCVSWDILRPLMCYSIGPLNVNLNHTNVRSNVRGYTQLSHGAELPGCIQALWWSHWWPLKQSNPLSYVQRNFLINTK